MMAGAPVVLVHGLATSAERTWREPGWIDLFTDGGRDVHAIDLMGHGEAPKPHEAEAYNELEDHTLSQFPDEPVDAVGFSLGARTLLAIAADHPERFNRLVLAGVGTNLFERDEERGKRIANAIAGSPDSEDREAAYFDQLAQDPDIDRTALGAMMRRSKQLDFSAEHLAALTMPVLVALGDKDFAGPPDPLLDRLPNAELKTLKGVDHFATPKDFGFIDAVMNFFAVFD